MRATLQLGLAFVICSVLSGASLGSTAPDNSAGSLSEIQITELVQGDLKQAAEVIQQELERSPTDAALHKLAGDIFAVRAQGASLFSAPGLAKKCLRSYEKAVELDPNNIRYRMSLMQFYLFAPGIVGGSKKKGVAQAEAIENLDPIFGTVAESMVLLKDKENEQTAQLFEKLSGDLQVHPRIRMARANFFIRSEQFDLAKTQLDELLKVQQSELSELDYYLPYQALLQAGYLGSKSEAHQKFGIEAFERYLAEAPNTYRLTSKQWVQLFLGKSLAQAGQNERARDTLEKVKNEARDETLLDEIKDALKEIG